MSDDQAHQIRQQAAAGLNQLWQAIQAGRREPAARLAEGLDRLEVEDPRFLAALAHAFFRLQRFDGARRLQQQAIMLAPDAAILHLGLANIELALGDLAAARTACEHCLELQPGNPDALFFHSTLGRKTPDDNNLRELRAALDSPPQSPTAHARLQYALAKELEDLGRYDESFRVLAEGARRYRSTLRFDLAEETAFLDAIGDTWDEHAVGCPPPSPPYGSPTPIFITGLPRTGSTLVERILGAHSAVHSLGELPDFIRHLNRMMEGLPGLAGASRAGMVAASTRLDFSALGAAYLAGLAPLAGTGACFIDKLPQNALYLGLIHRALPDAKLVLVRRDPMDACYSMLKQVFTDSFGFSYDLDELAGYYIAHERLMRHWIKVLGKRLHLVRYEDLVDRQEETSRRLLEFCGLRWEDGCLAFHRSTQPSTTASASQVREPIYRSSIGKWRHFRQHLAPLETRLRAAGCLDG